MKRWFLPARTLVWVCCVAFLLTCGCKKKERLSASTFRLTVTPPASQVLKTSSLTLTARGNNRGVSVDVNPTWTVSPPTVGTVTPEVGDTVVFQPATLGDVVITATNGDSIATSQVAVVTYIPIPAAFGVYSDNGLPLGVGVDSDIFVGGLTLSEMSTGGYTPEGIKFMRASNAASGNFWLVTIDKMNVGNNKDLSSYSNLKFALRLGRVVAPSPTEVLAIRIQSTSCTQTYQLVSGSDGFNRTNTDWQEISIPISNFSGLNSAHVNVPFNFVILTAASSLTFDVDAVRWSN